MQYNCNTIKQFGKKNKKEWVWITMGFYKIKKTFYRIYNNYIKRSREISEITYCEAMEIMKNNENAILLDVRSIQEYQEYHLNNAINIPLYDLRKKAMDRLKNKTDIIILYCQSGIRSKKALNILKRIRIYQYL